jgi:1-acyl-sn-glycerol-3-phosphate acyltransferase
MEVLYRLLALLGRALLRVMGWRVQMAGAEHIPAEGAAVVVSNHISYLDPLVVGRVLHERGRLPRFLAKEELFRIPLAGSLLLRMRHVPVDRHGDGAGRALPQALERLADGHVVVLWPEGTISSAFVPAADEAKSGAARMAMAAGVPLIPVATWGGQRIATKHRPRNLQRGVLLVARVGEPLAYEPGDDPGEVTRRVMARLSELVDEAASTYAQRPAGPHDDWWQPRHLGGSAPSVAEAAAARARERDEKRRRRAAEGRDG